jgi:hypothetical protein
MTRINEMRTNPVIGLAVEDPEGTKNSPSMESFFAYLWVPGKHGSRVSVLKLKRIKQPPRCN